MPSSVFETRKRRNDCDNDSVMVSGTAMESGQIEEGSHSEKLSFQLRNVV